MRIFDLKNHNPILLILGSLFLIQAFFQFFSLLVFHYLDTTFNSIVYFSIAIFYTIYYIQKKGITWINHLKLVIITLWSLLNALIPLKFFNLLPVVYLLLVCALINFVFQITRWVNADLSLKPFNFLLSTGVFILGIQLLFRVMHWPGMGIILIFSYQASILIGLNYILQAIKISSKNQTMK